MWTLMNADNRSGASRLMRRAMKGLVVLFMLGMFTTVALAQTSPPKLPLNQAASEVSLDMLTSHDLSVMSEKWWSGLAADIDENLIKDSAERIDAMRKVIFLATYYPDKAKFNRNTTELYNIYRFNKNEEERVMALAALFAGGDDSAMRLIAYHAPYMRFAPWEDSDLVRHVTEAAIMRYYGTPSVTVEPPAPINAIRNR